MSLVQCNTEGEVTLIVSAHCKKQCKSVLHSAVIQTYICNRTVCVDDVNESCMHRAYNCFINKLLTFPFLPFLIQPLTTVAALDYVRVCIVTSAAHRNNFPTKMTLGQLRKCYQCW